MRGSPPVQLTLLLLVFLGVGIPLVRLTHGGAQPSVAAPAADAEGPRPVFYRIRYAQKPSKLVIKQGSSELPLPATLPPSPLEGHASLAFTAQSLEWQVLAEWPPGTPETALTIEVEPDHLDKRSQTNWSIDGRIEDVFTFAWKP